VDIEEDLMRLLSLVSSTIALAIALLAGPSLLQAQEASPAAAGASILEEYGDAWSSGDASRVAALYTEEAVREDIPTGITSHGRAEIEALATGLFATDDDVRLEVTNGFVGEKWAVVEWTFSGVRKETGGEVTFPGVSVLELVDGQISRESDYYDLPQMQQQISEAGGTPGALETPTADADAASGSVTIRVFTCPADLQQDDHAALVAGCTPLDTPETTPTLRTLSDDASVAGTATEPGVYHWDNLAFGDYGVGGSGQEPANQGSLRVTDASGTPLQNPVLQLAESSPHVEYFYFYFQTEATPTS
jgi:steroid delta-isomerase-like uncharacterized protein